MIKTRRIIAYLVDFGICIFCKCLIILLFLLMIEGKELWTGIGPITIVFPIVYPFGGFPTEYDVSEFKGLFLYQIYCYGVEIAYYFICYLLFNRSIGQILTRVIIVDNQYQKLTVRKKLLRSLLKGLQNQCYYIFMFPWLCSRRKETFYDRWTKSKIITMEEYGRKYTIKQKRMIAYSMDWIIFIALRGIIFYLSFLADFSVEDHLFTKILVFFSSYIVGVFFVFSIMYYFLCYFIWSGSVGQMAMGIEIVNDDGKKVSIYKNLVRSICKVGSMFLYCIPMLLYLFPKQEKVWYDFLLKSKVVERL